MGAPSFHTIIKSCGAFGKPQISLPNNRNARTGASQRMPRSFLALDLIFPADLLRVHERIRRELRAVEVGCVELHAGDLAVVVGRVVIDAALRVPAVCVDRVLKLAGPYLAAALLLLDRAEDVEELTDAFEFGVAGSGVHFCEGNFSKTGGGGQVSGKTEGTHAAAVGLKFQSRGKCVLWLAWGEGLVVVELEHLLWEWWVVGQYTYRIFVDMETVLHGFDNEAAGGVCEDPVKLGAWEVLVELRLPAALAPVKLAVMPLVKKDGLPEKAREIIDSLKFHFHCQYDEKDSIGKRYRRQDAIGTPYCVTVDHQTLEDNCVTLRNRDTMQQERVAIAELNNIIADRVSITSLLKGLQ